MSVEEARAITARIKANLDADWELVLDAYQRRADIALGYPSFDVYVASEFSGCRIRLPREKRAAVVKSLREHGMSIRAIATVCGVDKNTVACDLGKVGEIHTPDKICGLDGKQHPSKKPGTRRKITLVDKVNNNLADMQKAGLNLENLLGHKEFDEHREALDFHCRESIEWLQDILDRLLRQVLDHATVEVRKAS